MFVAYKLFLDLLAGDGDQRTTPSDADMDRAIQDELALAQRLPGGPEWLPSDESLVELWADKQAGFFLERIGDDTYLEKYETVSAKHAEGNTAPRTEHALPQPELEEKLTEATMFEQERLDLLGATLQDVAQQVVQRPRIGALALSCEDLKRLLAYTVYVGRTRFGRGMGLALREFYHGLRLLDPELSWAAMEQQHRRAREAIDRARFEN